MKNLVKSPRRSEGVSPPFSPVVATPARVASSRRRFLAYASLAAPGLGFLTDSRAEGAPARVAFVYVSPVADAGWTHQHDLGRQAMERTLGQRVTTRTVANVAEGPDAERVIRDLATQGFELIFATSFGYLEPALRVARDFPAVRFEHAGGYKLATNLATYNARFYEGRFLAGMLAGGMSKSNTLGYVAGFPIPEVIQGINAFVLGARKINPQANLRIIWTNTWYDPGREAAATDTLVKAGADVVTHHTGSSAVPRAAEAAGIWAVGYHSDMRAAAPRHHLVSVTHHWGRYYTDRVQALLADNWHSAATWGSMTQGFVSLQGLSPAVPTALREQVEAAQAALQAGRLSPFAGPVRDNEGQIRIPAGTELSDGEIMTMNWLTEGIKAARLSN